MEVATRPELPTVPTPEAHMFSPSKWATVLGQLSHADAQRLRQHPSLSDAQRDTLTAHAARTTEDTRQARNLAKQAFDLKQTENAPNGLNKATEHILVKALKSTPLVSLLAGWVQSITIYKRGESSKIRESEDEDDNISGLYTYHSRTINIENELGALDLEPLDAILHYDADEILDQLAQKKYYDSTILHELGHAFHHLCGLDVKNIKNGVEDQLCRIYEFDDIETLSENVEREEISNTIESLSLEDRELELSSAYRNQWQQQFASTLEEGHARLITSEEPEKLTPLQRAGPSEYAAEAFCAYLSNPDYLRSKLPTAYDAFSLAISQKTIENHPFTSGC